MSRHHDKKKHLNRQRAQQPPSAPKPMSAEERAALELAALKRRKRQEWIARKVEHWNRFGTQSVVSPITGAAVPKWKLDADKQRGKQLTKECHRHCWKDHKRRASV